METDYLSRVGQKMLVFMFQTCRNKITAANCLLPVSMNFKEVTLQSHFTPQDFLDAKIASEPAIYKNLTHLINNDLIKAGNEYKRPSQTKKEQFKTYSILIKAMLKEMPSGAAKENYEREIPKILKSFRGLSNPSKGKHYFITLKGLNMTKKLFGLPCMRPFVENFNNEQRIKRQCRHYLNKYAKK